MLAGQVPSWGLVCARVLVEWVAAQLDLGPLLQRLPLQPQRAARVLAFPGHILPQLQSSPNQPRQTVSVAVPAAALVPPLVWMIPAMMAGQTLR
jgi:hypothetical protein